MCQLPRASWRTSSSSLRMSWTLTLTSWSGTTCSTFFVMRLLSLPPPELFSFPVIISKLHLSYQHVFMFPCNYYLLFIHLSNLKIKYHICSRRLGQGRVLHS